MPVSFRNADTDYRELTPDQKKKAEENARLMRKRPIIKPGEYRPDSITIKKTKKIQGGGNFAKPTASVYEIANSGLQYGWQEGLYGSMTPLTFDINGNDYDAHRMTVRSSDARMQMEFIGDMQIPGVATIDILIAEYGTEITLTWDGTRYSKIDAVYRDWAVANTPITTDFEIIQTG